MINPSYELILRAMGDADAFIQWNTLIRVQRSLVQGVASEFCRPYFFFQFVLPLTIFQSYTGYQHMNLFSGPSRMIFALPSPNECYRRVSNLI